MPQQVPSPRRHLSLFPLNSYGERARVRGNHANRDDSDCPSPQPSPRTNAVIQSINSGGEREPVEAADAFSRARTTCNLPRPVPSPRRQLVSEGNAFYGERVRVRGDQKNRDGLDCPSPQPSPRANTLIQLVFHGGEREPVEVADAISHVRTPYNMPLPVPSPRRQLVPERNKSYGERVRVRGDQINRDGLNCPSPQPSPRANDLIQLMNSGGEREPVEAILGARPDAAH